MDAVGQRIPVKAHQQAEDNLRIAVTALFRETRLAQLVLTVSLKIQCRHVIEHNAYVAAQHLHGVAHADVLYQMLVAVVQLVKVAVYPGEVKVLVVVVLQVLHRCRLARRK